MSYYNDMSKFGTNVDTTEQKRLITVPLQPMEREAAG